jgi:hypothetical protein
MKTVNAQCSSLLALALIASALPSLFGAEKTFDLKRHFDWQIATAKGQSLLEPGDCLGGELRAVMDDRWGNNRSAICTCHDGDVCAMLGRSGRLGPPQLRSAVSDPGPHWIRDQNIGGALALQAGGHLVAGGLGQREKATVALWIQPESSDSPQQALLHTDGWEVSGRHLILLADGRVKRRPVIKAELEFNLDGDEMGDMHLEETTRNVYYAL